MIRPSPPDATSSPGATIALVLAAGRSMRMAPWNKLLLREQDGRSVIQCTVDSVLASCVDRVIVVIGHHAAALRSALAHRDVLLVEAADHAAGLSASLRAGLLAVPPAARAVLICLGDMPRVKPATLNAIALAHGPASNRLIVVPRFSGQRGNPVLWDQRFIPELIRAVSGDAGGRTLMAAHEDVICPIDVDDPGVLTDLDTQEDASALSFAP